MMSFGTSPPPQENRLRNAFEETFQRLIYYCTFTICPLRQHPYDSNTCMDKRVELHIVFYVPSRAHSKLYIIIAFDMFLTEINSEDGGIFLYLSYICRL